ncbi:hypothetical protein NW762_011577 [Fusarium torreyae]|uniref:Uncharacterized protein n=1 Tax=Fusarium torreyae TaxID=1237075 RepID=A0A9W8RRW8_9HYPO|nr:hypothetical protein NW762_011577 [Fusarium torreyae]
MSAMLDLLGMQKIHRIIFIVMVLCFSSFVIISLSNLDAFNDSLSYHESQVNEDRRLALVMPATSPSPNLCKTIITALALNFPSPVLINWGVDYHDITHWKTGKNLPKIPGFVKYLDNVLHRDADPSEKLQETDIVVIIDGYDTWFQLPPEVLLNRYHDINEKANQRLRKQWSGKGPMPMRQTIVVASEKHCYPNNLQEFGVDAHCFDLPDSPMRKDLYGPETDKNYTNFHENRSKWINGGFYMGPAGDLRRFFRRALFQMEAGLGEGLHLRSEQGMLGQVIGEQELWRKWKREHHMPDDDLMGFMERDFEYHVGFDYGQVTSLPTMGSGISEQDDFYDGAFVRLGDQAILEQHAEVRGISPSRLRGLPDDIKTARNPLAYVDQAANWSDMPLYADFFTDHVTPQLVEVQACHVVGSAVVASSIT